MGVYIGSIWVPYVSLFDVDRGNRRVEIVKHIDKEVPPHFAEFPNPILSANIQGTLIQNSTSPKTADDYAEDILSLLDKKSPFNYIHSYQGRSGWLSVGDAESPNDADTPLSREYTITGNFLPANTYRPRMISNPAIITNAFSLTLGSDGCDNYIPLPKGADVSGVYTTIIRTTKDGDLTLVKDNSGDGVVFDFTEDEFDAGECKVWDSITGGNIIESSWKRVYNEDHEFTGDCIIENGIIRYKLPKISSSSYIYIYIDSSWTVLSIPKARYDSSPTIVAANLYKVIGISNDEVKVKTKYEISGKYYYEICTVRRGNYFLDRVSIIDNQAAFYDSIHYDFIQNNMRFGLVEGDTLLDGLMDTSGVYYGSNGDNFTLALDPAVPYICIGASTVNDIKECLSSGRVVYMYQQAASAAQDHMWCGAIPFYDCTNLFKECESMNHVNTSFYTGTDASPKTGNTGLILDSSTSRAEYSFIAGTDLPLGTYRLFIRCKDSAQIIDDLQISVYNTTDSTFVLDYVYKTLTAAWGYVSVDVTISDDDDGDYMRVKLCKTLATANTIDLDYVLWVPISSTTGNFPRDVAHQALCESNLRRELVAR